MLTDLQIRKLKFLTPVEFDGYFSHGGFMQLSACNC